MDNDGHKHAKIVSTYDWNLVDIIIQVCKVLA